MVQIDWEKERQRLTALYTGMEEAELKEIAEQRGSLTEVAQDVLQSEMSRRGIPLLLDPGQPSALAEENPAPPPPVTIRRYLTLPEAEMAKSILNSAGIESFLAEQNIVRVDWFISNAVGGIKLLVRDEDAVAARQLL